MQQTGIKALNVKILWVIFLRFGIHFVDMFKLLKIYITIIAKEKFTC